MEDEEEVEDAGLENPAPNKVNVEELKLQHDKQRGAQTKLLSEMHDTMKDSKK